MTLVRNPEISIFHPATNFTLIDQSQTMSDNRQIKIFDTTLRDGEQSPGASMNLVEKMEIAQALIDLGVNVIEAGFPIASPGDFEAVQQIASNFRGAEICGLARSNERDIDRAWEALKGAHDPRIHVFLATSAIHREFKLKMSPDEIIERAVAGSNEPKAIAITSSSHPKTPPGPKSISSAKSSKQSSMLAPPP